jgi:transposase-like protein
MCGTTGSSMKTLNPAVARVLKRLHFPLDVVLTCVCWYVACPLSLWHPDGVPEKVTIDKSDANLAALEAINADRETPIKIRQSKYLNNLVEQDHRVIKRRTRPMSGFKTFRCARILLAGIEVMHMIAKNDMNASRP